MRFFSNELKAVFFVDVTGCYEDAIGPEHQFLVAPAAGEANALLGQARAQSQATGFGFDQQQSKFGDRGTTLYHKDRANDFSVHLRNPATLSLRVVVGNEIRHDLGDQGLEMLIPAILLCIEHTMPVSYPSHIARLVRAKHKRLGT